MDSILISSFVFGITNTVGSAIARKTNCGIHLNTDCEIGVVRIKAYTSQIVVMAMLALAIGVKVKEVLNLDQEMKVLAEMLVDEQSLLVSGRGYNYATALEGALKVKELSVIQQLHAWKGSLVVMCTKGDATSVCVGGSCRVIEFPQVEDCLQPVINIVPLQTILIPNFEISPNFSLLGDSIGSN